MGLVLALLGVVALVLVIGYVRAHPKPADEPLEVYADEVAQGVAAEVEQEAVEVVEEVKAVAKRVRKPRTPAA
jgi:hypothetical protein